MRYNRDVAAPKKSLGQHFLINENICQRIVRLLDVKEDDQIVEIGPGAGALTDILAALPHKRLQLIEKDAAWAHERAKNSAAEVLNEDAMDIDWKALLKSGYWKIIGNLPYNIASPLIWNILAQCRVWQRMVLMVQKEVGQRLCAMPGSRKYGALSVWVQAYAQVKYELTVSPGSFMPPPKVDSAVISFLPSSDLPQYPHTLSALLHLCFQKRRKQLGTIFKSSGHAFLADSLRKMGIDPQLRPENLTCAQFMSLAQDWAEGQAHVSP